MEKDEAWYETLAQNLKLDGSLSHFTISLRIEIVKIHFMRDQGARRDIEYELCNTNDMKADILTKPLTVAKFAKCKAEIGLA